MYDVLRILIIYIECLTGTVVSYLERYKSLLCDQNNHILNRT
jgi:hypothetical protein